jgi:hypothetical protein
MTTTLELLGKATEAPAAVPAAVHEDEPCHRASIPDSMLGHIPGPEHNAIRGPRSANAGSMPAIRDGTLRGFLRLGGVDVNIRIRENCAWLVGRGQSFWGGGARFDAVSD